MCVATPNFNIFLSRDFNIRIQKYCHLKIKWKIKTSLWHFNRLFCIILNDCCISWMIKFKCECKIVGKLQSSLHVNSENRFSELCVCARTIEQWKMFIVEGNYGKTQTYMHWNSNVTELPKKRFLQKNRTIMCKRFSWTIKSIVSKFILIQNSFSNDKPKRKTFVWVCGFFFFFSNSILPKTNF